MTTEIVLSDVTLCVVDVDQGGRFRVHMILWTVNKTNQGPYRETKILLDDSA